MKKVIGIKNFKRVNFVWMVLLAVFLAGCAITPAQKVAKAQADFKKEVPAPDYRCGKRTFTKKIVRLEEMPIYPYMNCEGLSRFYIIQKLNDYEVLAYPCNAFGCNAEEVAHIIWPKKLGIMEKGTILVVTDDYCGIRSGTYNYTTIAGFTKRVPSIRYSVRSRFSQKEREAMRAKEQRAIDAKYEKELPKELEKIEAEYKSCNDRYNEVRSAWENSTDIKEYCRKYTSDCPPRLW